MTDNVTNTMPEGVARLMERFREAMQNSIIKSTSVIHEEVYNATPVRTGMLQNSIKAQTDSSMNSAHGKVFTNTIPYAMLVEFGYPAPLTIKAKNGKALHWTDGSGEHFAKSVTIPPRPAHHFFTYGFEVSKDNATQAIIDEFKDANTN